MRDYANVSPFFWAKGSGKRLRKDALGQVVALYLATSPGANMIGIYFIAIATIANDTGHSVEEIREALARVATARFAFYDEEAELVWIPNHARFEIGAVMKKGDKRRPKVLAELAQVDGHRFANEFRALYGSAFGIEHAPALSPAEPPGMPLPAANSNQEGASADLGQDRTGQDRTGPGRTGQVARRVSVGTSGSTEATAVFEAVVSEVTGRPFALATAPFHIRDLCDAVNAHAPPDHDTTAALAWLRTTTDAWVRTLDVRATIQPSKLLDWLNMGRPDKRAPRGRHDTRQPLREPNPEWLTGSGKGL
jgi:hypothetical protein